MNEFLSAICEVNLCTNNKDIKDFTKFLISYAKILDLPVEECYNKMVAEIETWEER